MEELYSIKDLSFSYDKTEVLDKLNLAIYRGDFIGIVGNNGSGKSTLLKLMVGELKNFSGDLKLFGQDIRNFNEWSKIGYVAQVDRGQSLAFPVSVREMVLLNLYSGFSFFKHAKRRHWQTVDDVLGIFGIKDLADKNYNELSGGQKQKVMIAKAMVHNPELLIFDEPTVGVDDKSKKEFFSILDHINKDHGISIIMVTHEMDIASDHFNRKVIIKDKKIYE